MARLRHRSSLCPELVCLPGEAKVPRLKGSVSQGRRLESNPRTSALPLPSPPVVNAALCLSHNPKANAAKERGECVFFSEKLKREETRGSRAIKSDDTIIDRVLLRGLTFFFLSLSPFFFSSTFPSKDFHGYDDITLMETWSKGGSTNSKSKRPISLESWRTAELEISRTTTYLSLQIIGLKPLSTKQEK